MCHTFVHYNRDITVETINFGGSPAAIVAPQIYITI